MTRLLGKIQYQGESDGVGEERVVVGFPAAGKRKCDLEPPWGGLLIGLIRWEVRRRQGEQNDMVCVLVLPVDREVTTLRGQSAGGSVTAWKLLCPCAVMATAMGQKGH